MNCDRIAPYYEFLEHLSFGKSLERRRCAFLRETQTSKRAIVCGGGDGRFLARLLRANSRVLVDFVDLSPGMIELAERRVAGMGPAYRARVRFYVGDVGEFQAQPKCYDLIVTNFFLDCFSETELSTIVARLAGWGAPRGRWLVSDFSEVDGAIGHLWTSGIIKGLYAAFEVTTGLQVKSLANYVAALARLGYRRCHEETAWSGLLHSSLWTCDP